MRKVGVSDGALSAAVDEMARGLVDADLGGHLVKKRVALPGQGKRGGVRMIVATTMGERWFFLFGFSKNERASIDKDELKLLQEVAADMLSFDAQQLADAIAADQLMELTNGQD